MAWVLDLTSSSPWYSVVYIGQPYCENFVKKTDHLRDLEDALQHDTTSTTAPRVFAHQAHQNREPAAGSR
jgi:hypothetical protein